MRSFAAAALGASINDPMAKVFFDGMKPESERDPRSVEAARKMLEWAYAKADEMFASRGWAAGFTCVRNEAAPFMAQFMNS